MNAGIFKSKVDSWLYFVFVFLAILAIIIMAMIFIFKTLAISWVIPFSLLLSTILPIWLLKTTYYTITEDALLIKSGPFNWKIDLSDIVSITPTRNPLSSPALSLDRLAIKYNQNKIIMISPENKALFLEELAKRKA